MPEPPRISIVIPVHNEQDDVTELAARLQAGLADSHEIIFVDDGSTDQTWNRLRALYQPGRIHLIRFRRIFGKTAALMAGLSQTRGEIVFTMDGDLQDDPAEIPHFLAKLDEGYDLVTGWKRTRHDPWHTVVASRIFNAVVRFSTGISLHDVNCGFKAFRGNLARSLNIHGEQHRFIPVLAAARGYRVAEIAVQHHPRLHGRSKYGLGRFFKGFFDLGTVLLITRFAERPSHAFGFIALALGIAGALCLAASLWLPLIELLLLLTGVLWSGAMVLLAAGWVAEFLLAQIRVTDRHVCWRIEERLD